MRAYPDSTMFENTLAPASKYQPIRFLISFYFYFCDARIYFLWIDYSLRIVPKGFFSLDGFSL
jgi:hypothetical protein